MVVTEPLDLHELGLYECNRIVNIKCKRFVHMSVTEPLKSNERGVTYLECGTLNIYRIT